MFVKVENNQIKSYPYTLAMFKQENKAISFPSELSDSLLAEYGLFRVTELEKPEFNSLVQNCYTSDTPYIENGQWVVGHIVENKPLIEAEQNVRTQRNELLKNSDWIITMCTEKNTAIPVEWQQYRQALRDITAQEGFPYNITWPTKP